MNANLAEEYPFLNDGGQMGELTRAFDWAATAIGPPKNWPQSLRTIVSVVLTSKFPMFLWWGPEMIQIYNDAYRPSLGNQGKHPNALGQRAKDCWPEIWDVIGPLINQVQTTGEAIWSENQLIPIYRNGQLEDVYWTFSYSAVRVESGQVGGILVVCNETTDKVHTLRQLKEHEQQLEKTNEDLRDSIRQFTFLTDFVPQIVWATQPNGEVDFFNRRWYEFTGLSVEQSLGGGWGQILHPDDVGRTWQVWQNCLATGQPYEIEYRLKQHDGQYRWWLGLGLPFYDAPGPDGEPGEIMRWFGTCTDIHDKKVFTADLEKQVTQRTNALQMANIDLQRSNENLERFAYVASHDLQEPLRKIRSFGDILQTNYGSQLGEGADLLERMLTAAERMSVLIKDLLTFSRIRTQRQAFTSVTLTSVVRGVLSDVELAIQDTGAVIEVGELPTVPGDTPQLGQLFQNLIANALKFQQPDLPPRISLTSQLIPASDLPETIKPNSTASQFYAVSVTDNGIGFDEKYTDRIFQVFQRLHGRSRYTGTGIGLAIVQKVIDNHNGAVQATSQPGQGATFTVYLPAE